MKTIAIVGAGFTGTMISVHLIHKLSIPCKIIIINERETLNKGIAFNPYSNKHLLNVTAGKMSAFSKEQNHFVDWVMKREHFMEKDSALISNSYLPRRLYGEYL